MLVQFLEETHHVLRAEDLRVRHHQFTRGQDIEAGDDMLVDRLLQRRAACQHLAQARREVEPEQLVNHRPPEIAVHDQHPAFRLGEGKAQVGHRRGLPFLQIQRRLLQQD